MIQSNAKGKEHKKQYNARAKPISYTIADLVVSSISFRYTFTVLQFIVLGIQSCGTSSIQSGVGQGI